MSWVIQRDPDLPENKTFSPWKGCLHILHGKGWCATNLAKPTQFTVKQEALDMMKHLASENPRSGFRVVIYEEVFQGEIKLPPSPPSTAVSKAIPKDWAF